jgi:hypothetical protein
MAPNISTLSLNKKGILLTTSIIIDWTQYIIKRRAHRHLQRGAGVTTSSSTA